MSILPRGTTVDTTNLQQGELLHVNFAFYNVNSIQVFSSVITVVCEKKGMIWIFATASKQAPVIIIRFILPESKNKNHPRRRVRVDEDGDLENSTVVTDLLIDQFRKSTETTVEDAS